MTLCWVGEYKIAPCPMTTDWPGLIMSPLSVNSFCGACGTLITTDAKQVTVAPGGKLVGNPSASMPPKTICPADTTP